MKLWHVAYQAHRRNGAFFFGSMELEQNKPFSSGFAKETGEEILKVLNKDVHPRNGEYVQDQPVILSLTLLRDDEQGQALGNPVTAPQKPVVLPEGTGWNSDPYNHGRNDGIRECKAAIEAAGGVVKELKGLVPLLSYAAAGQSV